MRGAIATKQSRFCASHLDCFADARNDAQVTLFSRRDSARALPTTTPFRESSPPQEGGEAPKGACQPLPRMRRQVYAVCATHLLRGCAPNRGAPAFRRYAAALAGTPIPARLQAMLPGTWTAHDANIMRGESRRALPALSCPSPVTAPHASAVMPKGMMPKAAPERVASPRGGTALAPLPKVPSRRRPSMSEIFWM